MILSSCEDSSDTDEEESARLKEAVLGNISLNLESSNKTPRTSDTVKTSKPSLRDQDHFDAWYDEQELQTTPEFKAFLSKRLSDFIESNVSTEYIEFVPPLSQELHGVKLLNGSTTFINIESKEKLQKRTPQKIIQRRENFDLSSCSDSEDERHRLAEAVVSYKYITENALPLQIQTKGKVSEATDLRPSSSSEDRENTLEDNDKQIQEKSERLSKRTEMLNKIQRRKERDHYMGRANDDDSYSMNVNNKYSSNIKPVHCRNGDSCRTQNSRKKKQRKDGDSSMTQNHKKKKRKKDKKELDG